MGKTYYCDYCDRSFKDDIDARKKHLSSLQHSNNRTTHYSIFKEPETILEEEYAKTPCKRYMTIGNCAFGLGCRFSHYTPSMIWELQRRVTIQNMKAALPKDGWPNPEDIIKEYFKDAGNPSDIKELNYSTLNTASESHNYPNLPQSLRPITSKTIVNCEFSTWG